MRRRKILKWTTLIVVSIATVLTSLSFINRDIASAASYSKRQTQGSLQVLDKDGKPASDCPLKHTDVKAQISGFISRVTVTQDFENPFPEKIEAVYKFPLPDTAAVDDLTMTIGERVIKGKMMRREEAKATYDAAKQQGKIASLLDQEQPNLFTQQVANILPNQQVRIVISYVETLQYEDGEYSWTFPMVAAERYTPARQDSLITAGQEFHHANLSAVAGLDGSRGGHDISLEVDLDAGLPIVALKSETHETETQINEQHALVRLKDRNTIPNKDFVMTYRVAGETIDDAVLAHRTERGGFFTLILQPPRRVAPEDVMPKELVFVLDTSGSMDGFPLEKAKETMNLALSTLYPHDTFNLITFAGDTEVLFPDPVPATPENLQRARKFLNSRKGDGGTEMMSAIKAALDPSDSQYHVRIACFLTDGQVSNENEIIAEVQKHQNARVFAMGFGPSPNRYLLDRMSRYGRGDVNYVEEGSGETSAVARRFNDRVRNPLLTDISIDWGSLPVTDVYPRNIPDLFAARPLVVSGRYSEGAKGTIRLKGKMAGQDFVREIEVTLPDKEDDHDVLSTLWARRRIEDLSQTEIGATQDKSTHDEIREEITKLGLDFKLMTQYTSFVAVDEVLYTGGEEPTRVEVQPYPGSVAANVGAYVTITSDASTACASVTDISTAARSLQELPLQGRSFIGLLTLTPGVVPAQPSAMSNGLYFVNGARANSNQFKLDGVSVNYGITPGGESPAASAAGNTPALTASGGANSIATLAAIEEINIQTAPVKPEDGPRAGAQVEVKSRAGSNEFHGNVFHFFGNDALDASDWFANSRNLPQPLKRLNLFGGTIGGPIRKDHSFFLASYEGLRLRQSMTGVTDVPSLISRAIAPAGIGSLLNAFPLPNGPTHADGFAEFAASFANPARHDVGSFRLDQMLGSTVSLRVRYNFADSDASLRGGNEFSLNTTNRIRTRAQTISGALTHAASPNVVYEVFGNYSRMRAGGSYTLQDFGGAVVNTLFPAPAFAFDLNSRNAALRSGAEVWNRQRQFNFGGTVMIVSGNHSLEFGGDYRRMSPTITQRASEANVLFDGVTQAVAGVASRISDVNHAGPQQPVFNTFSFFGQDQWRKTARLTLTYGLRWEVAPAPATNGVQPFAVDQVSDPAKLTLTTPGSPLWKTTFTNFAPRASFAYDIGKKNSNDLVLRGGVGVAYDVGQDFSGDVFADSIPFLSTTGSGAMPFLAFDPSLKLPYTVNWNFSLQKTVGDRQSISAAYVGASGNRLWHTETLFDQNPSFPFLRLVTNRGSSDYRALQLMFERPFTEGLETRVSYTWARSLDNVGYDSAARVIVSSADPAFDRGPSDSDIRHYLAGYVSYSLPAPVATGAGNKLFRNWVVDSVFNARSSRPLNVAYMIPTPYGVAYLRPDVVDGALLYLTDASAPGGWRLNPAAFVVPADQSQGDLGRNSLRGFPLYQIDLALRRKFSFTEYLALQFQADAYNVFNHTNFEDPLGNALVVNSNQAFGESTSLAGRSLRGGGFSSFYSFGGARTMRFSVKFLF